MNPPPNGAQHLRASLRRIGLAINRQSPGLLQRPPEPAPDAPQPISEWGRDAEDRLRALEQKLTNQNRLLALSFVAIIADAIAKLITRSGP